MLMWKQVTPNEDFERAAAPLRRWAILTLMVVAIANSLALAAAGQEYYCAEDGTFEKYQGEQPSILPSDTLRALLVFFRFSYDTLIDSGCSDASQQWSVPDVLPGVAQTLLAPDVSPPFPDSSLTDYYYQQSNGRFIIFGGPLPRVLVTAGNESSYSISGELDRGKLTREILDSLDADPTINLSEFDHNSDGYIDHLFLIPRRLNLTSIVGRAAGISSIGYTSLQPEYGAGPNLVKVHSGLSGSYNRYGSAGIIFPQLNLLRLMAHEFGHDMWRGSFVHIPYVGGSNGVPQNASHALAYALMVGSLGQGVPLIDARGDLTISAWERDILGTDWINCTSLAASGPVTVGDLYTSANNCKTLTLSNGPATRKLYIANRQRIGKFDQLRTESCFNPENDHGLMTTGLLIQVVENGKLAARPQTVI